MPKISKIARIYIYFLNVSVLLVYCRLYIAPYHKWLKENALIMYMYADVIWNLKMNVFLRQSIWSTNKIWKEIAVLECKNFEKFLSSLAPLARIFIDFA